MWEMSFQFEEQTNKKEKLGQVGKSRTETDSKSVAGSPKYSMERWLRWKKKQQTDGGGAEEEEQDQQPEGKEGKKKQDAGIRPTRVKGEERKKCLHCCFHYLAAVVLQAL